MRVKEALLQGDPVHAGPMRVLLLSERLPHGAADRRVAARHVERRVTWSRTPTWDAAAAEALLDHPGCCVLLDAVPTPDADAAGRRSSLLEYVRMSAPDAPIVLLCSDEDEDARAARR